MRKKRIVKASRAVAKKPVRLSPAGRKYFEITPRISKYVSGFKAETRIGIAGAIVADIAGFKKNDLPMEEAKKHWVRRSADTVIKTRSVVRMDQEEARRSKKPAIMGCMDFATATTVALRAAGFKAWVVRTRTHAYTKFVYRNQVWVADAASRARPKVRPMTDVDKRNEDKCKKTGKFAEGQSFAQIGLKSYDDFSRYN